MRCPFLREAQVKFCQASAFKKMIVRTPSSSDDEKCSSSEYVNCPAAKLHREELPSQSHCPFLQESLAQYCSAAAVTKFVPYSESLLSRCGSESHRYCELFLSMAHPDYSDGQKETNAAPDGAQDYIVEGLRMPVGLSYSPNHMWLDVNDDGCYHAGVDALFAKVIGRVERVSFLTARGVNRPAAVLTVNGVDIQVVFPNRMLVTGTNTYLRADPERLISEPYGSGWLFEGKMAKDDAGEKETAALDGLIRNGEARNWMVDEVRRLSEFVHDQYARQQGVMMDGGTFAGGVALQLNRDEILNLFNEFFSPYASWRHKR